MMNLAGSDPHHDCSFPNLNARLFDHVLDFARQLGGVKDGSIGKLQAGYIARRLDYSLDVEHHRGAFRR